MSKLNRDIQTIIRILIRNDVSAIYPTDISHLLKCPTQAVENVLERMVEEGIFKHLYELHCEECGGIIDSSESPRRLTSSPFPCPHCFTQMDSIDMNKTISAFYPIKEE